MNNNKVGRKKSTNVIHSITNDDVQLVAVEHLGRNLSDNEMEFFARKFSIDDWTEIVKDYIDYTIEEVEGDDDE